jgi:hypothetical protein
MLRPISAEIGAFAITGFRFLFCFFVLLFCFVFCFAATIRNTQLRGKSALTNPCPRTPTSTLS